MRRIDPSAFDTRLCAVPGCDGELDTRAPLSGPYAGWCDLCRRGEGVAVTRHCEAQGIAPPRAGTRPASEPPGRGRQRAPSRRQGSGLTLSEIEVLELVADGLTNEEIAVRRGRPLGTVKSQLRAALDKLGAVNRAHAVSLGIRAGLID